MGYQNIRFGQRHVRQASVEDEVCQTYNTARQTKGLACRAAFMQACQAFSVRHPEVPGHMVPQRVAEILNPNLNFRTGDKPKANLH